MVTSGTDSHMLPRLHLIGHPRLLDATGNRVEMTSKKAIAVLGLLALASDGIRSRAWLQQKLWGSRDTKQAQNSLRRELSNMRKSLPCVPLVADHRAVRLDLDQIWIDTRDGTMDEIPAGEEFLEGLDIAGEEDFEEWLRDARSQIEAELQDALGLADEDAAESDEIAGGGAPSPPAAFEKTSEAQPEPLTDQPGFLTTCPTIFLATRGLDSPGELPGVAGAAPMRGLVIQQLGQAMARLGTLDVVAPQLADADNVAGRARADDAAFQLSVDLIVAGDGMMLSAACVDLVSGLLVWSDSPSLPAKLQQSELQLRVGRIANGIEGAIFTELQRRVEPGGFAKGTADRAACIRIIQRANLRRTFTTSDMSRTEELQRELDAGPELREDGLFRAQIALRKFWWGPPGAISLQTVRGRCEMALASLPGDHRPLIMLGIVERWSGNFAAASHLLERALAANPASAPALANLGVLALLEGNLPRALQMLRTAEAISPFDPEQPWINAQLAVTCLVSGETDEALRHAGNALALQSRHALPALVALSSHAARGQTGAARRLMRHPALMRSDIVDHTLALMPFANPKHLAVLRQGLDRFARY